jgi:hypothetical protein
MAKEKNPWLVCLKHITLASLADLGVYAASAILLAAVFEGHRTLLDMVCFVFLMVFYAVFFYRFHMYPRISTYMEHGERFDPKGELMAFLRADGKIMLIIYGICAVVTEISVIVTRGAPQNPVAAICMFPIGPFMLLPIPVLRSVICFVYASVVLCVLTLLRSRKIHQNDLTAEVRRRER